MIDFYTHRRLMILKGKLPVSGLTLNVGCGGTPQLLPASCRSVNIDTGHEHVRMPNYLRAQAEHLPFKDSVFENALLFDVLEHIEDDRAALEEIRRIVKAGGRLYLTVPCSQDDFFMIEFPAFLKKVDWDEMERRWGHVRRGYTIEEIKDMFSRHFKLVHIERGVANFSRIGLQLYFLRGWEDLWHRSRYARLFLKLLNHLDNLLCRNRGHLIFAVFERLG